MQLESEMKLLRKNVEGIVSDMSHCFVCGSPYVEIHHCIHGTANRKKSEKWKLKMPLCNKHHTGSKESPHQNADIDKHYKQMAQQYFEDHYGTREYFRKEFGKSFL